MLICDICTEEVPSEDDMKSHLLLAHMEQDCSCPFCTITGLAYDELNYHIHTAHADTLEPWNSDEEEVQEIQNGPTSNSVNLGCSQNNVSELETPNKQTCQKLRLMVKSESNMQSNNVIEHIQIEDAINEACDCSLSAFSADSVSSQLLSVDTEECSVLFQTKIYDKSVGISTKHIVYEAGAAMECPFCCKIKASVEELEFHVKTEHIDLVETPTKGNYRQEFECPMCSLVCANYEILQEHVNLHLEESVCVEASADTFSRDIMLARQLQDEEDKRQKSEGSEREREEFQKLQRLFGLDNSGGYQQQSLQNLERAVARGYLQPMDFHLKRAQMMESIATGIEDGRTKTSGVLEYLYQYYNNAAPEVSRVWLCSPLDHFSNAGGDKGWGCGFRNLQMLLSSVLKSDSYKDCLQDCRYIPCIPKIQTLIENAWKEGFDPQGASHFNGKLQGTKAWIGATEIYCLLTSLHLKCRILDFHKPSSSSGTHPLLFEWILKYYSSDACPITGKVICSTKPAIYLQHQGHSRTIVGIEERKNKSYCLLIFDPGHPPETMQRLTRRNLDNAAIKPLRKQLLGLKHNQYQIVLLEGELSPDERAVRLHMSKVLRAERIP